MNESQLQQEWLETNGLGGYASSTVSGINTRRYHGLLVAALHPPAGRTVLLSKLEETLVVGGVRYALSANQYPGAVHPQGFDHLVEFRRDPFPVFVFEAGGVRVEKCVLLVHGENTVVIEYSVSDAACELEVRPLIAFRDYHCLTHENNAIHREVAMEPGSATVSLYWGLPALHLAHDAEEAEATGAWYRNFEYRHEQERGLDFHEDLFQPFVLRFRGGKAAIIASTEQHNVTEASEMRLAEIERRRTLTEARDPLVRSLTTAADQFLVRRGEGKTIIAGYHWFTDWGRDTMISLPGLTLATGRLDDARAILLEFAASVDQGMLPNRFPDAGDKPEFNTVDATLWFFQAIHGLNDPQWVREHLYATMRDIIDWHVRGTRYGIRMDADGLLHSGEPGVQLTWMDAKVGDWVVTPRQGKPVEIQALWYNALCIMAALDGEGSAQCASMAERARASFLTQFWNEADQCLFDVVDNAIRDAAIRPNQIFAVSLPHSMVSPRQAKLIVETVQRELLTPAGLRSLSPRDSQYRPRYEGDGRSRDSAYHQGTVWPWLLGPFVSAYWKVHSGSAEAQEQCRKWIRQCAEVAGQACPGQIAEIADGDPPHTPRGCVAQAWSVAELLRAAIETGLG